MPSLNDLGEFKFSFNRIALSQKSDGTYIDLPYDDLPLPDTEPPPMNMSGGTGEGAADNFDFGAFVGGLGTDDPPPPLDTPGVDFDINAFLQDAGVPQETLQDNTSAEEVASSDLDLDTLLQDSTPVEETAGSDLNPDLDMNSDMDALLQGMGEELDTPVEAEAPADFDMDALGEPSAEEPADVDAPADFDMDSLLQDTETPAEEVPAETDTFADFDMDSLLQDTVASEISAQAEAPFDADAPADFDMDSLPEDSPSEEFGIDHSDAIDLGGESLEDTFSAEPAQPDVEEPEAEAVDSLGADDFDLSGLDLQAPVEETPVAETSIDEQLADNFDLPETPATEIFDDVTDTGLGIDMGGESADTPAEFPADDFDMGGEDVLSDTDFGNFDLGDTGTAGTELGESGDTGLADMDFGDAGLGDSQLSDSDFDVPGFDESVPADLGSEFAADTIELGSESGTELPLSEETFDSGDGGFASSEFELPGLEDIFEKSKMPIPSLEQPKQGFFSRRKKRPEIEVQDIRDVEEIQLSQNELDNLLRTLASYPLNLRIACEEMIAEQVLLPQQLSKLIRLLIDGAHVRETAALAEEILGRPIIIPKSYEKMTGAAFQAEKSSFAYIFIHNFLPVLRLFAIIAAFIASVIYLGYKFVYIPVKAENLYKRGYERIAADEYSRANELFHEAFLTHRKKKWFYSYAEAFIDKRRFLLAEQKYEELLRAYPRDKKGVLDYAFMQTYYLLNYEKASELLHKQLLDYAPNDIDGLVAAGDNFLLWADSDPARFYEHYENARFCFARLLELKGWQPHIVERMLRYFIRTDNLKEVIYLRQWFDNSNKRKLSPASTAELGGYLLDKQLENPKGVPDVYIDSIESVRDMLLQAVMEEPTLPEPHYHLARYHKNLNNTYDERRTLENAIRAFDIAKTETVKRRMYRVDAHYRYGNLLINNREFIPAENEIVKGIQLYEDYLNRNLIRASSANNHLPLGQLYAAKGDLEYFVKKTGSMDAALSDYRQAERYGYAPPEVLYRMGSAYYQQSDWGNALSYLFKASKDLPLNRRMLHALGNAAYQRGDYHAAQGYYDRLLDILEDQRTRLPVLLPNDNPQFLELGERLMIARNNAGVVYQALGEQTGRRDYRSKAMGLYAESSRAWDSITRNPESMVRMRLTDAPGTPSINLGYLNANNALRPVSDYDPQIFPRIDKDVLEPSKWEELVPISGLQ